jgi:hypothetical protein
MPVNTTSHQTSLPLEPEWPVVPTSPYSPLQVEPEVPVHHKSSYVTICPSNQILREMALDPMLHRAFLQVVPKFSVDTSPLTCFQDAK